MQDAKEAHAQGIFPAMRHFRQSLSGWEKTVRHSEPLSPKADAEFGKALEEVCDTITRRAEARFRGTDAWKSLWAASEHGLQSLLSEADHQTGSTILVLADVIKQKFGLTHLSDKLYNLLKALPFAMWHVREKISDAQGNSCCADKARLVYYEEVLAEIQRIQESQK